MPGKVRREEASGTGQGAEEATTEAQRAQHAAVEKLTVAAEKLGVAAEALARAKTDGGEVTTEAQRARSGADTLPDNLSDAEKTEARELAARAESSRRTAANIRAQIEKDRENQRKWRSQLSQEQIADEDRRITGWEREADRLEKEAAELEQQRAEILGRSDRRPGQGALGVEGQGPRSEVQGLRSEEKAATDGLTRSREGAKEQPLLQRPEMTRRQELSRAQAEEVKFGALVDQALGSMDEKVQVPMGRTGAVLQALGARDLPVTIAAGTIRKDTKAGTVVVSRCAPCPCSRASTPRCGSLRSGQKSWSENWSLSGNPL